MLEIALAAILPPGNIERDLADVQTALFRDHGIVSGLALPPFWPLSVLRQDTDARALGRTLEGLRTGWQVTLSGPAVVEGWLVAPAAYGSDGAERLEAV